MTIHTIVTEADHKAALARIDALMDAVAGTPEAKELSILAVLVEDYESRHFPIERLVAMLNPDKNIADWRKVRDDWRKQED